MDRERKTKGTGSKDWFHGFKLIKPAVIMKKCYTCKKIKSTIEYHGKQYCTWYCVKKSKR